MKMRICFLTIAFTAIMSSCDSQSAIIKSYLVSNDARLAASISLYKVEFINDVIKYHWNDSIKKFESYHWLLIDTKTNELIIDSSSTTVHVRTYSNANYDFIFVNRDQSLVNIIKNGLIIYTNKSFPELPSIKEMEFDLSSNTITSIKYY